MTDRVIDIMRQLIEDPANTDVRALAWNNCCGTEKIRWAHASKELKPFRVAACNVVEHIVLSTRNYARWVPILQAFVDQMDPPADRSKVDQWAQRADIGG